MGKHRNRNVDPKTASYEVGYGKTDPGTRFSSTNQPDKEAGLKKKKKQKDVDYYLDEVVSVPQKDGAVLRMTRREMGHRNLANKFASGDLRAISVCDERERRKGTGEETDPLIFDEPLRKALLADFEAEMVASLAADGLGAASPAAEKANMTAPDKAGGKTTSQTPDKTKTGGNADG